MRYETVQAAVIRDPGEVAVMLNSHSRIRLEWLKGELVAGSPKSRRVELTNMTVEQSRDEVQDG